MRVLLSNKRTSELSGGFYRTMPTLAGIEVRGRKQVFLSHNLVQIFKISSTKLNLFDFKMYFPSI